MAAAARLRTPQKPYKPSSLVVGDRAATAENRARARRLLPAPSSHITPAAIKGRSRCHVI
jgi:hypothetical protein